MLSGKKTAVADNPTIKNRGTSRSAILKAPLFRLRNAKISKTIKEAGTIQELTKLNKGRDDKIDVKYVTIDCLKTIIETKIREI